MHLSNFPRPPLYGIEPKRRQYIQLFWKKTENLEEHLFRFCSFSPSEMETLLRPDNYSSEFLDYIHINSADANRAGATAN